MYDQIMIALRVHVIADCNLFGSVDGGIHDCTSIAFTIASATYFWSHLRLLVYDVWVNFFVR